MLVESVMTRPVVSVEPWCSVESAAQLMREGRFRHLPVVREGHLIGIVSDRELGSATRDTIGEVMHTDVITAAPDTPVELAASLLSENKIGALPIVDRASDTLVGIVSQTDLFAVLARLLGASGPSTRLELQLSDLAAQLAVVANLAQRHGLAIVSLIALRSESNQAPPYNVVLRIGSMRARAFADDLRAAGISVDLPEGARV